MKLTANEQKRYGALRALRAKDIALLAEPLLWHTDISLGKAIIERDGEAKKGVRDKRDFEEAGFKARFDLATIVALSGRPDSVVILKTWALRNPKASQFAVRDLWALAMLEELPESLRRGALDAIARIAVELRNRELPFDIVDYAACTLARVAWSSEEVPPAIRKESISACASIGGRKVLRYLKTLSGLLFLEPEIRKAAEDATKASGGCQQNDARKEEH